MPEICDICGLPKDICACDTIEKQTTQRLKIYTVSKKFKKLVTIVDGLKGEELSSTTKFLKHKLACGGSHKEGVVELQGNHKDKVKAHLIEMGYPAEAISVV
ncbi:stress response translation initiation inhibitor YciH [Candidatus Micrarchaeota archaeon]|nr:stress response translation initiation inhibitor YciH [Candidatus Micrarchaeota archaeon]MBI5177192.1 stress response translation initiation inhibitor YciH [Candidatus Micrarchaeota archaeon]